MTYFNATLDEVLCVTTIRGNQSCDTMNGGSCIKCSFRGKLADMEIKLFGCSRGYETSIRYKARIDEAEETFDELTELILDREYMVRYNLTKYNHININFSRETTNG